MPYISMRDGREIYVRQHGQGEPVILLHGFGMQSSQWLPFTLPLSRRGHFILPDFRGFGRSHSVSHNQQCAVRNYAEDLVDIIAALKLTHFKLGGISMGALVALTYLVDYAPQNQVKHYLHIDQAPKCLNSHDWHWGLFGEHNQTRIASARILIAQLKPYIAAECAYEELPDTLKEQLWIQLGDFFASALSKNHHKKAARLLCQQETLITKLIPTSNWQAYIHCLKAYLEQDYDLRTRLPELSTPVSLIVGMKSEMYPCPGQLRMADQLSNCEVIPFRKSGHAPLIDQPLKFMHELRRLATR